MKNLNVKLIFISVVMLASFSCNKLEITENNTKRDYDYYGEEHNKYIKQILTKTKSNEVVELEDLYTQLKTTIARDFNISETELPTFDTILLYYNNFKNNSTLSNYESFSTLESRQKIYINELDSILANEFSSNNLLSKINNFEQKIVNDNLLAENKKEIIFISSSIAKYSYNLWTSDGNICYAFPWQVVGADVFGGLIGGVFGGNPVMIVFCSAIMSVAAYEDYKQNY